jgi:hypothetical protein
MIDEYIEKNGPGWLYGFDHVMYVLPKGPDWGGGVLAYAYVGINKSVYNDKTASYIGIQVHEIGHNLFMSHSGEGGSIYGDHTCYMGMSLFYLLIFLDLIAPATSSNFLMFMFVRCVLQEMLLLVLRSLTKTPL